MEDKNTSTEFSDDAIRRFLLGRLSSPDQLAFERQLFSEPRLDARVRLAELDLADDYAGGRISATERDLFEEKFLVSADRRRQLEVSVALRDRFASAVKAEPTFIAGIRSLLLFNRPAWRYTFAVLIFMLLVGGAWVIVEKKGRIKEAITSRWVHRHSPTPAVPLESNHPTNNALPEHQTSPSPMPVHDQTPPSLVSNLIVLTPAGSSEIASVPQPGTDQQTVRLVLALKSNQAGTYRAELLTVDGKIVFIAESINTPESGSGHLNFDVPARLLKTGSYQVRLARDNAGIKENLGGYYFRVQ